MSGKGGQAKVYFVLYLAIVVELLIIIVERDEAEEHLHKRNNETMRIVESILSQLYSGSGSEGINTKPQDEITLPAEADMAAVREIFGQELKTWRQYQIDVGVTDVTPAIKRREGESAKEYEERIARMLSLANVEDLEYQIFFIPSQGQGVVDTTPAFQSDDYISSHNIDFMQFDNGQSFSGPNGEPWVFVGAYKLTFDQAASHARLDVQALHSTFDFMPLYKPLMRVGNGAAPRGKEDSVFYYCDERTREAAQVSKHAQKRSFIVNFEPPDRTRAGIYKLRFASRTNRILGVSNVEEGQRATSDEDAKVNIGTVQLAVKDLKKVGLELRRRHRELDRLPALDELAATRGGSADISKKMQEFSALVDEAVQTALDDPTATEELIGMLRLYEYIARLVTPGQSVNFDQNRSNFDINIRVQTAKPSTARPYAVMLAENRCFTNARHVFEVEAGPYKGNNVVSGRIIGPTSADIVFTQEGGTPERDKSYKLRGVVSRELPAGQYIIEVTHRIADKAEITTDTLYVYEAGIRDESRTQTRFANRMVYGSRVAFDFIPNSGNDITASQFKTIFTFDGGHRKEVQGYKVTRDAGIEAIAAFNRGAVNLVWIQPITYQEFLLFRTEAEIRLDEPAVMPDFITTYSGNVNRIKVELRGVTIFPPNTGLEDRNARVSLSEPVLREISGEINGYTVTRQPEIAGGDAESGYIIEFELSRNSGSTVRTVEGTLSLPIAVTARHPTNGKTSRGDGELLINISHTPSTGGAAGARPQQPTGGGGARQQPQQPQQPQRQTPQRPPSR